MIEDPEIYMENLRVLKFIIEFNFVFLTVFLLNGLLELEEKLFLNRA